MDQNEEGAPRISTISIESTDQPLNISETSQPTEIILENQQLNRGENNLEDAIEYAEEDVVKKATEDDTKDATECVEQSQQIAEIFNNEEDEDESMDEELQENINNQELQELEQNDEDNVSNSNTSLSYCSSIFSINQGDKENRPPFTCSLYISNCNESKKPEWLDKHVLKKAAAQVVLGRIQVEDTQCGLMAAFSDPMDAKRLKEMNIARIFKKPVQITSFVDYNAPSKHVVLLLNVPWSLPLSEIEYALRKQGIRSESISRMRTFIRVVVSNNYGYERLLREGLNFYRSTSFKAITERMASEIYSESDSVMQCYR